jgi:hypothetical protein
LQDIQDIQKYGSSIVTSSVPEEETSSSSLVSSNQTKTLSNLIKQVVKEKQRITNLSSSTLEIKEVLEALKKPGKIVDYYKNIEKANRILQTESNQIKAFYNWIKENAKEPWVKVLGRKKGVIPVLAGKADLSQLKEALKSAKMQEDSLSLYSSKKEISSHDYILVVEYDSEGINRIYRNQEVLKRLKELGFEDKENLILIQTSVIRGNIGIERIIYTPPATVFIHTHPIRGAINPSGSDLRFFWLKQNESRQGMDARQTSDVRIRINTSNQTSSSGLTRRGFIKITLLFAGLGIFTPQEVLSIISKLSSQDLSLYVKFFLEQKGFYNLIPSHYPSIGESKFSQHYPYRYYAAYTYDMAIYAIVLNLLGFKKQAEEVLDIYAQISNLHTYQSQPNYHPTGGIFHSIRVLERTGTWWPKWDWGVFVGPMAWIGMASLIVNPDKYKRLATYIADWIIQLQDKDGGFRMGPKGQWHKKGLAYYYNTKSTENNESVINFFLRYVI